MLNNSIKYLETLNNITVPDEGTLPGVSETQPEKELMAEFVYQSGSPLHNEIKKQSRVDSLIWAFRDVGSVYAQLNPLGSDYQENYTNLPLFKKGLYDKLTAEEFDLSSQDMDQLFYGGPALNHERRPLREILETYNKIYCSTFGVEFLHIQNKTIRKWLIQNLETNRDKYNLTLAEKKVVLEDLIKTEEFEHFLNKNYIGQKRFSVEGGDSVIPCLHYLVNQAFSLNIKEIIIGTTHRGRITILDRILQVPPEEIFSFFEESYEVEMADGGGDVKYHIGYTTDHKHEDGSTVRITLPANPSHLESVGPVAEGLTRGLQDKSGNDDKLQFIPVIIHGEAAISGQGVVAETLNLANLEGYSTGGTIHIIINNQVGFTTSPRSAHSSSFASDIAKYMSIPILHVNGDDPEAAVHAMKLAIEYRQTFQNDIFIDIICYRKYGHNEGDDPSFTHPRMYQIINNHKSVATIYLEYCLQNQIITKEAVELIKNEYVKWLKDSLDKLHQEKGMGGQRDFSPQKISYLDVESLLIKDVGISKEMITNIVNSIHKIPPGFQIHEKLKRILDIRLKLFKSNGTLDWAFAETVAFGSILMEGHGVRMSGQDSERGTFSQRHLVWWEINVDEPKHYIPLNNLKKGQSKLSVYDSPLSEYSILSFEYGYSLSCPDDLVIWEAQYGDFVNGAQVIIDNYLIASEAKWNVKSGLVLLLPHAYEGQGPEHSNAHLERFLQLCAQENIQVCNLTTPAQYFCLLRRQVLLKIQKPLVIMTPKSLLRNPLAISKVDDLMAGHFQFVIDDPSASENKILKVLFCTGKIYYDLFAKRLELKANHVAIVRVEQLYPFPRKDIEAILTKYKTVENKVWVQEEPQNRGAWTFMKYQFENLFGEKLKYAGRNPSASPATGSMAYFKVEQDKILYDALV